MQRGRSDIREQIELLILQSSVFSLGVILTCDQAFFFFLRADEARGKKNNA